MEDFLKLENLYEAQLITCALFSNQSHKNNITFNNCKHDTKKFNKYYSAMLEKYDVNKIHKHMEFMDLRFNAHFEGTDYRYDDY